MHLLPNVLNRRIHHGYHFRPHHHIHHARKRRGDVEKGGGIPGQDPETSPSGLDNDSLDPLLESVDQAEANSKKYRILPIFSGIMVPFAVMLAIPSLTGHWYVKTDADNVTVETQPNPVLLDVGMAFSIACGVLANICLVVRFAEREVRWMTWGAIVFLTLHDLINIPTVTAFGIIRRVDDGFTYGQPFWFTVCSTIASTATNITLIIDLARTPDFRNSGSGLTTKQRSLVIISIILLTYVSFGSLIQTKLQNMTFIDALYFSVVSIETIGFGDIPLQTNKARIFTCFYIGGGLLNIALAVAMARDALLEAAVINFRARRRMHERERRLRSRWRAAVRWRLRLQGRPVWVHQQHHSHTKPNLHRKKPRQWFKWIVQTWDKMFDRLAFESDDPAWRFLRGPRHRRLNVEALTDSQLHAAALEAGAPLAQLVPSSLGIPRQEAPARTGISLSRNPTMDSENDPSLPLTHFRMGAMLSLLGNFAVAVTHSSHEMAPHHPPLDGVRLDAHVPDEETHDDVLNHHHELQSAITTHGVPFARSLTIQEDEISMVERLEGDEQNAFYTRLTIALVLFVVFWMGGAAIFMRTERWSFGIAVYFCFISFTTVGYGDYSPKTPAGRSIFVVWALLGVATVTILISVVSEAYSTRYKSIIRSEVYHATSGPAPVDQRPNDLTHRQTFLESSSMLNSPTTTTPPAAYFESTPISRPVLRLSTIHEHPVTSTASFQVSPQNSSQESTTIKILAQIASLKSMIDIARAPSPEDPEHKLNTLTSRLEDGLHEIEKLLDTPVS
ncbi:hypothetical protein CPB83DRAFT_853192 [Crepidotus variabilis]|uniref:Potassium channel domain-containing protein n=1 Tax=Crepidotus variabilis TaxID=179855 RepID=A0A9P6EHD6_9AGAR|nr:hypothetical protein CPB83DRAFT_853192 [Crepidotus variabilis]